VVKKRNGNLPHAKELARQKGEIRNNIKNPKFKWAVQKFKIKIYETHH